MCSNYDCFSLVDMGEFLELGALTLPTLAGIKYTHTDLEQGTRCLHVKNGLFKVFLGADQVLHFISLIKNTKILPFIRPC